jgi:hypothetical protein
MPDTWTDWTSSDWKSESPYVDWWYATAPENLEPSDGPPGHPKRGMTCFSQVSRRTFSELVLGVRGLSSATAESRPETDGDDDGMESEFPGIDLYYGDFSSPAVPIPSDVINNGFEAHFKSVGNWYPPDNSLQPIPLDTVIVGVIDSGIALGHARFRSASGKTRILAAWQQGAKRPPDGAQPYLPFGAELYGGDIDTMLNAHSIGGLDGCFLEDDFNRASGALDMESGIGDRELAQRRAHGTFVLDVAAGFDPKEADPRIKIIAVNLPNRSTINTSGIFLDYFTIYALRRIADLADRMWAISVAAAKENPLPGGPKGFPIVINLSYGRNAGPKDGFDHFHWAVHAINRKRVADGYSRIHVVLPVGNHNLEQSNAVFELQPGTQQSIDFRVRPGDHTGNYLEIWSESLDNPGKQDGSALMVPLAISIKPPDGIASTLSAGRHRQHRDLGRVARLYCRVRTSFRKRTYRTGYLLCLAPTYVPKANRESAPAGAWTVTIRNDAGLPIRVYLGAQTDQSIVPNANTGLRPYLETPDYRRYDDTGRLLDSYPYPYPHPAPSAGDPWQGDLETSPVLQRHGSINATASSTHVIAIAGFRRSDGRPAAYSATGLNFNPRLYRARRHPSAALPTDDGPAHRGILAAGASSGSVVAFQGTSFASAAATRCIAERLKIAHPAAFDAEKWLAGAAAAAETAKPADQKERPPAPKVGAGRLDVPQMTKVPRRGPSV